LQLRFSAACLNSYFCCSYKDQTA